MTGSDFPEDRDWWKATDGRWYAPPATEDGSPPPAIPTPEHTARKLRPQSKTRGFLITVAFIVGALVIVAAIGASSGSREAEPDATAEAACEHFRNIAGDVTAGVLTDAELRNKLAEVRASAQASDESLLAAPATAMLSAATRGDIQALGNAVEAFGDECRALGL